MFAATACVLVSACSNAACADNDLSPAERLERAFARETLGEFWGSVCVTQDGAVVWYVDHDRNELSVTNTVPERLSHGGATGGFRSMLMHDRPTRTSIAVMSHNERDVSAIAERLMDVLAPPPARPTIAMLYLAAYPDDPRGIYDLETGLAWRIMPEYRDGGMTDKRSTIVVTDAANRFLAVHCLARPWSRPCARERYPGRDRDRRPR